MNVRNTLFEIASRNAGIVTTKDFRQYSYTDAALRVFARRHPDELIRHGTGVYEYLDPQDRLDIDWDVVSYAVAQALVGEKAYISGSSVLGFYHLANVAPLKMQLKTTSRITRALPPSLDVSVVSMAEKVDIVRGVRLQNLAAAFREADDTRASYRLEAVEEARKLNLISGKDADDLTEWLTKEAWIA